MKPRPVRLAIAPSADGMDCARARTFRHCSTFEPTGSVVETAIIKALRALARIAPTVAFICVIGGAAKADTLSLACEIKDIGEHFTYSAKIDIDDNGAAFIQANGLRTYFENEKSTTGKHWFRINQAEIVYGIDIDGVLHAETIINRQTGVFQSLVDNYGQKRPPRREVGKCSKASSSSGPNKF